MIKWKGVSLSLNNKSKIRNLVKKLVPMDDIMFKKMADNKLFCQEILWVFMGDPGLIVLDTVPQSVLTNLYGRSVTLDTH